MPQSEKQREFTLHLAAFVIGMLVYAISGLAYVHASFVTRPEAQDTKERIDRYENSVDKRLEAIQDKLDEALRSRR